MGQDARTWEDLEVPLYEVDDLEWSRTLEKYE
jgi:hypothetical protein